MPDALTAQGATQILRAETDIVRAAVEDQARGLRQELGQSLKGFQELTLAAFGTLRDGIDAQVRGFGERLDGGTKAIDERAAAISTKLNDEMAQMRSEANTNRETLRTLIEQKLDHSIGQQADASKVLRDELGGNFHRLGTRVSDSLTEAGQIQKERLENVTGALTGLSEKLEKAQDSLRTAVESRLDAIRQESATKLEEMRQTVDEKLQTTLESRLGESFNRVVEQLERVHKGIGEMQTLAANVGDLRNVLTNVKVRGTYGEVQLALLLEQFLSPDQFVKNASVRPDGTERVEYAIKFPADGEQVLLPIDSKFPREDYDHLQEAIAAGDAKLDCAIPARPRKQDQRLREGHQHQIHQSSAHLGIRDSLYSDRKPVCRGAAAAWPVRTVAAGLSGDDRRTDQPGRAADVLPNGLPVPGAAKTVE